MHPSQTTKVTKFAMSLHIYAKSEEYRFFCPNTVAVSLSHYQVCPDIAVDLHCLTLSKQSSVLLTSAIPFLDYDG